jgi:hypothetical protein
MDTLTCPVSQVRAGSKAAMPGCTMVFVVNTSHSQARESTFSRADGIKKKGYSAE